MLLDQGGEAAWACVDAALLDVFRGDAAEHLARVETALVGSALPADRALYGVAATIAAVIACEFDRATRFATQAALDGDGCTPEVRRLSRAAAVMARAMAGHGDPAASRPDAGHAPTTGVGDSAKGMSALDLIDDGPRALLLRYFLAEAALSSGAFEQADALIAGAGLAPGQVDPGESGPADATAAMPGESEPADATVAPLGERSRDPDEGARDDPAAMPADRHGDRNESTPIGAAPPQPPSGADGAAVALQLLAARSAAFHGRRDEVIAIAQGLQQRASIVPARAQTVLLAIGCYGAAVTGDRDRSMALAETVLTKTRGDVNYLSVGACLYVAWAFRTMGQLQRAAALLVSAAGPTLDRCKVWDRALAAEVLIEAALARGDRYRAGALLRSTGALARYAVAASSVSRARGAVALSAGRLAEAQALATASVRLDESAGASTEVLRGLLIEATALSESDPADAAARFLRIAHEADATGNEAVRSVAARRWRELTAASSAAASRGDRSVMTARQRAVATLLVEGHSNAAIGQVLFLSPRTVQTHIEDILRITHSHTRAQAAGVLGVPRSVDARGLTARQREVAELAAAGRRNAEISAAIGVGEKTVERHLAAALKRLGLPSRTALAAVTLEWAGADALAAVPAPDVVDAGVPGMVDAAAREAR
ncbi:LuxR C-terminal-related transcriptional regulator [Cnuibacter physcomitrellae]|uniref:helix-turn-helix transcriptional regulator n=1 Tax=Cnuibacter physcomitrellae TaxID=1619308 RepID=UPI002175BC12|nr:LuxR family transcriptional regulator [Cnuibacter physcomitrellae]MCS5495630.1 LuxR C-terminal-related transcriptional regulator [Cnuibacter physcomitrellae]